MLESESHEISLARLHTEISWMMRMCFWKNSIHWSSYPSRRKRDSPVVLKVAYFKNLNWIAVNFCKYHSDAVEVFRRLPANERFFKKIVANRYQRFHVWCIDGKHFKNVMAELSTYKDIEIEYVVEDSRKGLVIPEPFAHLGLTFYERRVKDSLSKRRQLGRVPSEDKPC